MDTFKRARAAIASKKIYLHTTLATSFVLQILATVGLVGYLSFRNGQEVINDLSQRVRVEVAARVHQQLENYFSIPVQMVDNTLNMLLLNLINPGDKRLMERYFAYKLQVFPMLGEMFLGKSDGTMIYVGRRPDGQIISATTTQFPQRAFYQINADGQRTRLLKYDDFDPRLRPWYKTALTSQRLAWSGVYQSRTIRALGMAATAPYFDKQGKLVAVFGTYIFLNEISHFLENLKISPTGQVFIVDEEGWMLATSTGENLFTLTPDQRTLKQLPAIHSKNLLTRSTAQYLQTKFGNFSRIRSLYEYSFDLQGHRQDLLVQPYSNKTGLRFLVVVVIPEKDFTQEINVNIRTTVFLCLLAMAVATMAGMVTTRWISRPVLQVAEAAEAIAEGNMNQNLPPSRLIEIDKLAHSFNSMSGQLKASFTALEDKNEQLRIAEENYRSIFENALEGIFQSTPEGQFININPAMAQIFGYESASDMIQSITSIGAQLHVDPEKRDLLENLMLSQNQARNFECQVYRKDGSMFWIQIDARVVSDKTGKALYYEGLVQDISEQKQREEILRQQLESLRVEIDQQKREQQVREITETDFFQSLKAKSGEMRQRRRNRDNSS